MSTDPTTDETPDTTPKASQDADLIAMARAYAAHFDPETGDLFVAVDDPDLQRLRDVSGDDAADAGLPSDIDVMHVLRRLADRLEASLQHRSE